MFAVTSKDIFLFETAFLLYVGLGLSLVNLAVDGEQWIHCKDLSPSEMDICANLF